jgi:hypothetical protein
MMLTSGIAKDMHVRLLVWTCKIMEGVELGEGCPGKCKPRTMVLVGVGVRMGTGLTFPIELGGDLVVTGSM